MRNYGEQYIKTYKPTRQQIKLISAMRICKSPALGGKVIICNQCNHKHYIYFSCGHSQCPICQSIKREQWADQLKKELYAVPYIHTTFTLPHQLNGLARANPLQIYGLLMRVAWKTIKDLTKDNKNLGALPGMIAVLHTFGSDMKYHVHVHCLITFGGLTPQGVWRYPKHKFKIAKYRQLSAAYRRIFLKQLYLLFTKNKIQYHLDFDTLTKELKNKRWVAHNTRPTMDTKILEKYLARYINRIAISNSRLQYLQKHEQVKITYNEYKRQKTGYPAPKAIRILHPLSAIHQFLQHVLPPYFQKSRRYGIHAAITKKRIENLIPKAIIRNGYTVRSCLEILTQLIKANPFSCQKCSATDYYIEEIKPNKKWVIPYLSLPICRDPPYPLNISPTTNNVQL